MAPRKERRRARSRWPGLRSEPDGAERGSRDLSENECFASLHSTLRKMARDAMRRQSPAHTLQPTALVNEVFLKLASHGCDWKSPSQFLSVASLAMRCVLVDHARTRRRLRRCAPGRRVELRSYLIAYDGRTVDVIELDRALRRLESEDPRAAKVVQSRFFAGLTLPQVAKLMGIPLRTVERDWQWARVWLNAALS